MPIFEFKCNRCGNIFEQLVFPSDGDGEFSCPSCGGGDTSKLMSSFSCGSAGTGDISSGLSSSCSPSSGGFS